MKNLISIFVFMLIAGAVLGACSKRNDDKPGSSSAYMQALDSLLEHHEDFEWAKLVKIAEARQKLSTATTPPSQYLYNSLMFDEFKTYNSDSARKYVDISLDIARMAGNMDWETRSMIRKSELLTGTGLLSEAYEIMQSIDREALSDEQLIEYYGQMVYLYSHLGNYQGGAENDYYVRERLYKDSVMGIITPEHPEYLWYKGWDLLGTTKSDSSLIPALRAKLDASELNTAQNAKDAYILAKLYEASGDRENFRKYMVMSAMADVRIANAEIASLEELSKIVFDDGRGDIDRAYKYINYSLNKALVYPNRVRAFGISATLDTINKEYQARNHLQKNRMRQFLTLVCILSAVLLVMVAIIIVQNRRLRRQGRNLDAANKNLNSNVEELSEAQKLLNDANRRLKDLNADLKSKNEELNEANYVKEEYIGYIFTLCSNYIRKMEELRKSIHVKAVAKKYKEILEMTENTDMTKDELKEFYRSFDTIFLHIYPDFVSDFNSLLQDDKRITPREGELLNTELRIYALVRLGITDSIKIAEFLHCSPQTVYNNRFRVRNKALVPRKDFAESVRTLGKYMDRPS